MSDDIKEINELITKIDVTTIKPDYTPMQKGKVHDFFKWLFMLYPGKCEKMKEPEVLRNSMRIYSDDIIHIRNMNERFAKVKKLKQSGHEKYQWPDDALGKLTGDMNFLNHDYREVYPSHQKPTGELQHVKKLESLALSEGDSADRMKAMKESLGLWSKKEIGGGNE